MKNRKGYGYQLKVNMTGKPGVKLNLFGLERLVCATRVYLKKNANILRLASVTTLVDFYEKYREPLTEISDEYAFLKLYGINWQRVAQEFSGIIIAPYQWDLRLSELQWYYVWDCASGCIWNADVIKRIKRIY